MIENITKKMRSYFNSIVIKLLLDIWKSNKKD